MRTSVNRICLALMMLGAINWGLVGIFRFDVIAWCFGAGSVVSDIVYVIVAVSGFWSIPALLRQERRPLADNAQLENPM